MARLLENWPALEIIGENEASDAKHSILRSERMQIISKKETRSVISFKDFFMLPKVQKKSF